MRVDVKKFLFMGVNSELEKFFIKAQQAGFIHFIESGPNQFTELPQEINDIQKAIKVTLSLPIRKQVEWDSFEKAPQVVKEILSLREQIEKHFEEERILHLEVSRIEVFGDFNMKDINFIEQEGKCKVQFFCATKDAIKSLPPEVFFLGSNHGLDYFFAINDSPKSYDRMVEMQVPEPLQKVKHNLKEVTSKKHDLIKNLKEYQKYNTFLHRFLNLRLNEFNRTKALNNVQGVLDDRLFSITGWVPVDKIKNLDSITEGTDVTIEPIAIETTDVVPTYLENIGTGRIGEDLVHIYDTPSSTDKDPSLWVLFAFTFFFAMIVGDGGYGIILLALAFFLKYKFPNLKGVGKRFIKLCFILSTALIIWGVLINNFFGIQLPGDSPLRKVSLMNYLVEKSTAYHMEYKDEIYQERVKKHPDAANAKTPYEFLWNVKNLKGESETGYFEKSERVILLELALLIGVVHIILSFARNLNRNLSGIGWILFLIGGYLYFPVFLGAHTFMDYLFDVNRNIEAQIGMQLMIVGIFLATLFAIIKHKWLGLLEATNVIQVFADVMSYLRLYALALAGSIVALTINDLASQIPIVFAVILIIFAHIINLGLAIMGATIHGLRLNFLEWYHHSFEGGGKRFNPLKLLNVE